MNYLRKAIALISLLLVTSLASAAGDARVVYHINEGVDKATDVLRNVRNHLGADPKAKIVVVGHGPGINFMLEGAEDKNKNPFNVAMEELAGKGVEFRVCKNTLTSRNIPESKVVQPATIVPSGVAEIGRLQAQEGYVYLKP